MVTSPTLPQFDAGSPARKQGAAPVFETPVGCSRTTPTRSPPPLRPASPLLATHGSSRDSERPYAIERTTPPSTRRAAPLIAAASGLQTNATSAATSAGVANRLIRDLGRTSREN